MGARLDKCAEDGDGDVSGGRRPGAMAEGHNGLNCAARTKRTSGLGDLRKRTSITPGSSRAKYQKTYRPIP